MTTFKVLAETPHVFGKAQKMREFVNPYISLQDLESLCQGNEILMECLQETVAYSLRYTETVCLFEQVVGRGQQSNEDGSRGDIESIRKRIHDAAIDTINALSRALRRAGKENRWISRVGATGRAGYGKFALLIAFEAVLRKG